MPINVQVTLDPTSRQQFNVMIAHLAAIRNQVTYIAAHIEADQVDEQRLQDVLANLKANDERMQKLVHDNLPKGEQS